MIAQIKPTCATCRFFARFTTREIQDEVNAAEAPDADPDPDLDEYLNEYGKCVRYPPMFFHDVLNGEWPVVHESKFCGEYRAANSNPLA